MNSLKYSVIVFKDIIDLQKKNGTLRVKTPENTTDFDVKGIREEDINKLEDLFRSRMR